MRRQRRSPAQQAAALPEAALAVAQQQPLFELAEGLETPVQLIYLLTLLGFLVVGAYLVVRQVRIDGTLRLVRHRPMMLLRRHHKGWITPRVRTCNAMLSGCVQT